LPRDFGPSPRGIVIDGIDRAAYKGMDNRFPSVALLNRFIHFSTPRGFLGVCGLPCYSRSATIHGSVGCEYGGVLVGQPIIRVLVADDFEGWRRFVASMFQTRSELQIICEVSDGLEGVRKAAELQPDLIILDLGLPKLNGIEAARRIRRLSPNSKIIFVSLQMSADVVQESFRVRACGYVAKVDAGSELLSAVDAVLRGERFVGSRFAGNDFAEESDSQTKDHSSADEALAFREFTLPPKGIARRHEIQFYSDDVSFVDGFTQYISAALTAGNAVIVVATESHQNGLLARLQAHGLDIGAEIQQGRYISLNAADTLRTFMVKDLPDPVRFFKVATDLVMTAAKAAKGEHARVVACGECAPLLWERNNAEAAIQVERLWDEVARAFNVAILCGYRLGSFQGGQDSHIFQRICAEHSAVHSR
jgi:DNA-binding NarL/FixJ family response regulator